MGKNYRKWFSMYKFYISIYMYDIQMDFLLNHILQYNAYTIVVIDKTKNDCLVMNKIYIRFIENNYISMYNSKCSLTQRNVGHEY